jgi:hypothetical protein
MRGVVDDGFFQGVERAAMCFWREACASGSDPSLLGRPRRAWRNEGHADSPIEMANAKNIILPSSNVRQYVKCSE